MGGKRSAVAEDYDELRELFRHHIESFDHTVECGLETMFLNVKPVEIVDPFTKKKLTNILFFSFFLYMYIYLRPLR